MSLLRMVYYSAMIGGWLAFGGWLVAELLLGAGDPGAGWQGVVATCGLVGAAIGAGLNLVARQGRQSWLQHLRLVVPGVVAGGLGGAIGGGLGNLIYTALGLPRTLGWMFMGAAIGLGGGLATRSRREVRNGLIGGTLGGFIGGLLFDPILNAMASGTGMTSRATAFVLLGISIGALIGLVRVVLKDSWLTVLDGYRPGRQVILGEDAAILGRAEYATLPFLGPGDQAIEWEHIRISRGPDAHYHAEPKTSAQMMTRLNQQPITSKVMLRDGDVLSLGGNSVRYNERSRTPSPVIAKAASPPISAATPPPIPGDSHAKPAPERGFGATSVAPAPSPPASTSPPKPKPAPASSGGVATRGNPDACPRCGRVAAKGQRYCIVCDASF